MTDDEEENAVLILIREIGLTRLIKIVEHLTSKQQKYPYDQTFENELAEAVKSVKRYSPRQTPGA
jgi:hypothetical protein